MDKIYIWGTGRLADFILDQYVDIGNIIGFVDNDEKKTKYYDKKVIRPSELLGLEYAAVIVASHYSREIKEQAIELGLCVSRFVFIYDSFIKINLNEDYALVERVLGKEYAQRIMFGNHIVKEPNPAMELCLKKYDFSNESIHQDFVRRKIFELVATEIIRNNIEGQIAEAGVFRGEFARYLNMAFPGRKLYLFDSFEGFKVEEAEKEIANMTCTAGMAEGFKLTSEEVVMDKMLYPQNVIIRKGFFPESASNISEQFAFVSLDMDLELSTYDGLVYFYPKLSDGGYIFVHDYNSSLCTGVRKAVERFQKDFGIRLRFVPICDEEGTLVIMK